MIEFFLAEQNTLFLAAIGIVFVLGLLEGLGLIIGLSVSTLFDHLSPIDINLSTGSDISSGGLTEILGWLCLNRLPLLVWLVLFLTLFSISGYVVNYLFFTSFGYLFPSFIGGAIALLLGLTLTSRLGNKLAKAMPKNESSAIEADTFSGRVAQITIGTAKVGSPAEASFVDNYQQKHYVMVEPIDNNKTFFQGDKVVLIEKGPNCWTAASFD